jgi:hypothetical protein
MRSGLYRSVAAVAAASMIALGAKPVAGQLAGRLSGFATFAPVDAAALGVTRPASVGLFVGEEIFGAAGLGVGHGALRGFVGGVPREWSLGAGYAQTLVTGQRGSAIHTSIGGELVAGFRRSTLSRYNAAAANVTIPFGLTFGDPNQPRLNGPSLAIYVAPYAETGITRVARYAETGVTRDASYALGVGTGTRLSLGRFAVELMFHDFDPRRRWEKFGLITLGLNYRLGPAI